MPTPGAELRELYSQFGFIVVQWGHCEQMLEILTNILYNIYDCKKLTGAKRIPRPLAEKLTFVKKCILKSPSLAPFQSDLEAVIAGFEELTQARHDIIHGALVDMYATNGIFTFMRLETHPDIHEVKEFPYDLTAFPALKVKLGHLGGAATKIAERLSQGRKGCQ